MKLSKTLLAAMVCGALAGNALADTITLNGVVRDFKRGDQTGGHPDFETCTTVAGHGQYGHVVGLVGAQLGADNKPVFNPTRPSNDTMYSSTSFNQWYNDVAGTNMAMPLSLTLSNGSATKGGVYSYSTNSFFPIDGLLFGNQGQKDVNNVTRNFSFTYELHTTFTYAAGQNFQFVGDDDVYVFINGQKALDLGGVHAAVTGNIILFDGKVFSYNASSQLPVAGSVKSVDASMATNMASKWSTAKLAGACPIKSGDRYIDLGIKDGDACSLDFFFAERHVTQSNFRIDTSIYLKPVTPTVVTPLFD
ncbi:MAG: fibro-slime domain-containing protein [Planctomycetota bacterium]|nr:fibro-slime domain-containing protein [Planctomycetota bacterium]